MRINNNLMAMNTHRQLGNAQQAGANSMEKLSSGMRINRAGDDAAGLSISEKMRGQIRGLNQASRNSQDGISMIQTAEGALDETHNILQRMRELTVQAGNETNAEADLEAIQNEINELTEEIDGIAARTEFNGKNLMDGTFAPVGGFDSEGDNIGEDDAESVILQIGANGDQNLAINIGNMSTEALGTLNDGDDDLELSIDDIKVTDGDFRAFEDDGDPKAMHFDNQLEAIDNAIGQVSSQRSELGANQNRLEHTISNLDNAGENLQAAESRIRDVDMAQEMMEMTKQNILQQASNAMLAQANNAPQSILQLLG
ncbi:flagellin Hag [Isachenkonia alkalipeptolytica]|uniref:Flagellin n=1 Tax=Isachenkonia alkalipeptolytica TaxID=2565777 RepID=A0AA43XJY5_9CLOT|nr:flagellin Hag [Isachenkonia alkalipeptolytica]NBG88300.1 flagellin [Isachenkonia alkalipeptolytica]